MFDIVHKHKRVVQFILALIMLPFAFFGVDYYFRNTASAGDVATFDGGKITQDEFEQALREQQETLMRAQRAAFDPAMFDNPEVRFNIAAAADPRATAREEGERPPLPRFQRPGLRADRRRSAVPRRRQVLARPLQAAACRRGGSPKPGTRSGIRKQVLSEAMIDPIARGGIVARTASEGFLTLLEQQREVARRDDRSRELRSRT